MKERIAPGKPSFADALRFWFRLGWISFGGTAGHIALMHDYLVDKRKWISNSRFFHALSLCMLLPGPEAQQLSIYIGWQLHGKKGGIVAGTLFVLPSMLILLGLSIVYVQFGQLPWVYALFAGLKPAVIALIIIALVKIGRKSLLQPVHYVVALGAFLCIFLGNISLLWILVVTIGLAIIIRRLRPGWLGPEPSRAVDEASAAEAQELSYVINAYTSGPSGDIQDLGQDQAPLQGLQRILKGLLMQLGVFALLWVLPLVLFYFLCTDFPFWKGLVLFFTQTAFFTLGGSYTVLPYVAQFAVSKWHWLSKSQMVDGFALAETTPGPLIIVVGFVGFMAAYQHFEASLWMGTLGLLATVYYTFLPCFLFIFTGGPLIESTHGSQGVSAVLSLVTAAVVGVILNLTLFLGKDVVLPQGRIDWVAMLWVLVCLLLLAKGKINVVYLILGSILFGYLRYRIS
jgi:chromate transporter